MMAELDLLIRSAPHELLRCFERVTEPDLARSVGRRVDRLYGGDMSWAPTAEAGSEEWLLAAVEQARALDSACHESPDAGYGSRGDPEQWRIEHLGVYVVPSPARRFDGTAPKIREPYGRRGLLYHRVIPVLIGDLTINLLVLPLGVSPPVVNGARVGVGMFTSADWVMATETARGAGKTFVVTAFSADRIDDTIRAQVAAAFTDGCLAAIWPELCAPPSAVKSISRTLGEQALLHGAASPLRLVVAGSWHLRDENNVVNEAPLLRRDGRPVGRHRKMIPFADESSGLEGILPGREITVVVSDAFTATVGICLDFCNLNAPNPYADLPVDFVLVPSLGNPQTTRGHKENVNQLHARTGASVMVAQQAYPSSPKHNGHVVLHSPNMRTSKALAQKGMWATYDTKLAKQPRRKAERL